MEEASDAQELAEHMEQQIPPTKVLQSLYRKCETDITGPVTDNELAEIYTTFSRLTVENPFHLFSGL